MPADQTKNWTFPVKKWTFYRGSTADVKILIESFNMFRPIRFWQLLTPFLLILFLHKFKAFKSLLLKTFDNNNHNFSPSK